MSISHAVSTYTWQLPSKCLMTGILASWLMRSIKPLPPRGMMTSTNSLSVIKWPTASRSVVCTNCTASCGKPLSFKACCTSCANALLESIASEPPRKIQALPLLIAKDAASIVTLGRLSNTMPNTPIGTRIWPTRIPLGCSFIPMMSPMMSGILASCSHPCAHVSITCGVSLRRSTMAASKPAALARSMSLALSTCNAAVWLRNNFAKARKARLFCAADALAISADAALACTPSTCTCWAIEVAFIGAFSLKLRAAYRRDTSAWPIGARLANCHWANPLDECL